MKTAFDLIQICKSKNITISSCESLTAGLFTATVASVPGASSVLKGGLVTYFTQMKNVLAQVDQELIDTYGVISDQCAAAMARNTRRIMDVDYCVSFTGNAGPDAMENKPAGCVYCAISTKTKYKMFHFQFDNMERNEIRQTVVNQMIDNLVNMIEKE